MESVHNDIISEAIRIVSEGKDVILSVNGKSMLPFIIGGEEKAVLTQPGKIEKGKVYLAFTDDGRYVIHRVEKTDGKNVKLMGDGNIKFGEFCGVDGIKARVDYVISKSGKKRFLYSRWRLFLTRIWLFLKPLRRYLLFIYKKIKGI